MQERKVSQAPDLFSSAEMGLLKVKNRVVMAPLTRSRAGPGNVPTQLNALYYAQRGAPASSLRRRRKSHRKVKATFRLPEFTAPTRSKAGNA